MSSLTVDRSHRNGPIAARRRSAHPSHERISRHALAAAVLRRTCKVVKYGEKKVNNGYYGYD